MECVLEAGGVKETERKEMIKDEKSAGSRRRMRQAQVGVELEVGG